MNKDLKQIEKGKEIFKNLFNPGDENSMDALYTILTIGNEKLECNFEAS